MQRMCDPATIPYARREEGFLAFWKGNGVNIIRIFPYSAAQVGPVPGLACGRGCVAGRQCPVTLRAWGLGRQALAPTP